MRDVVITDCVRTAIGKMNGALSEYDEQELAAIVMKEVLNRSKITADQVEEVIFGHVKMNTYPHESGPLRLAGGRSARQRARLHPAACLFFRLSVHL